MVSAALDLVGAPVEGVNSELLQDGHDGVVILLALRPRATA